MTASELWPAAAGDAGISGPTVAALISGIVGTIVAGLALAQVFVVAYQASSSRPKNVD